MSSSKHTYWLPELLADGSSLENEYMTEWKEYLLQINSNEIKMWSCSNDRFIFYTPKTIQCVFDICKMLQQPPEVRYLAVDILDRFLVKHFFDVVKNFEQMENCTILNWQITIDRMLDQSLLRILSSIQLAVKYCLSCNIISVTAVQETIKALEYTCKYSKRSIIKSESRIYKTLNYNIPSKTPLTYLEMFFGEFQRHHFFQANHIFPPKFFILCIHILDVAIIYHQQLYRQLMEALRSFRLEVHFTMGSLEADYVTLAAAIVFVASSFYDPNKKWSKNFLELLCFIGECREHIVQLLAQQIINSVVVAWNT